MAYSVQRNATPWHSTPVTRSTLAGARTIAKNACKRSSAKSAAADHIAAMKKDMDGSSSRGLRRRRRPRAAAPGLAQHFVECRERVFVAGPFDVGRGKRRIGRRQRLWLAKRVRAF